MKYLNALNKIDGIGSGRLKILMDHFGSSERAWGARQSELVEAGFSENLASKVLQAKSTINPEEEWEILEKEEIGVISLNDENYPPLLKEITNPPYLLYIRGNIEALKTPMVAMVGSRRFTTYGKQVAETFARDLSRAGLTVVSGLALGIDAISHKGALDANGTTVAVLGSSIDDNNIYPRANYQLAQSIMGCGGTILSEYSAPTPPTEGSFPARNRIMAGMCLGTLVVEAGEKSGTLITAKLALDFNREVLAIPGSIFFPQSAGANNLIKAGAKMVTSVKDVLEEIRFETKEKTQQKIGYSPSTNEEKAVFRILSQEPVHIDRIIKQSKLETMTVSSTISMLEIKGVVKNIGGGNYIKL